MIDTEEDRLVKSEDRSIENTDWNTKRKKWVGRQKRVYKRPITQCLCLT